jgi:neurofibromin 1
MTLLPQEDGGFDLDPSKALGQDVERNQKNVQTVTTAFLRVVSSSAPTIPPCVLLWLNFDFH